MANDVVIRFKADSKTGAANIKSFARKGEKAVTDFTKKSDARLKRFAANWKKMWRFMSVTVVLAVTAMVVAFKKFLDVAANFESALVDMGKVTNQNISIIKKNMMDLPELLGTVTELTKGYYQVISAGVTDPVKALNLLTTAAQTSKAAHIDQASVIKGLTAIMAGFEGAIRNTADAADLLFAIEKGAKTTVAELIPVLGGAAKLASELNIQVNEFSAAFATITQTSGSTEEAMTRMQGVMVALFKPTKELRLQYAALGFENGKQMIKQLGFIETIKTLRKAADDAGMGLGRLIGRKEALIGLTSLASRNYETFAEKLEIVEDRAGLGVKAYERWQETIQASLDTIKGEFVKFQVVFMETFGGDIKGLLDGIASGIDKVTKAMQKLNDQQAKQKKENELKTVLGTIADSIAIENWVDLAKDVPDKTVAQWKTVLQLSEDIRDVYISIINSLDEMNEKSTMPDSSRQANAFTDVIGFKAFKPGLKEYEISLLEIQRILNEINPLLTPDDVKKYYQELESLEGKRLVALNLYQEELAKNKKLWKKRAEAETDFINTLLENNIEVTDGLLEVWAQYNDVEQGMYLDSLIKKKKAADDFAKEQKKLREKEFKEYADFLQKRADAETDFMNTLLKNNIELTDDLLEIWSQYNEVERGMFLDSLLEKEKEKDFSSMADFYKEALMQMGSDTGSFMDLIKNKLKNLAATIISGSLAKVSGSVLSKIPGFENVIGKDGSFDISKAFSGDFFKNVQASIAEKGVMGSITAGFKTVSGALLGGLSGVASALGPVGLAFAAISAGKAAFAGAQVGNERSQFVGNQGLRRIGDIISGTYQGVFDAIGLGKVWEVASFGNFGLDKQVKSLKHRQHRVKKYQDVISPLSFGTEEDPFSLANFANTSDFLSGDINRLASVKAIHAVGKYGGAGGTGLLDELQKAGLSIQGYKSIVSEYGSVSEQAITANIALSDSVESLNENTSELNQQGKAVVQMWTQLAENARNMLAIDISESFNQGKTSLADYVKMMDQLNESTAKYNTLLGFLTTTVLPATSKELSFAYDEFKRAQKEMDDAAKAAENFDKKVMVLNSGLKLTNDQLAKLRDESTDISFDLLNAFEAMGLTDTSFDIGAGITTTVNEWNAANEDLMTSIVERYNLEKQEIENIKASFEGVYDTVSAQLLNIRTSSANPADILERLAIQRQHIDDLQTQAIGAEGSERASLYSQMAAAWGQYLTLGGEAFQRPSNEYQAIFDQATAALEQIRQAAQFEISYAEEQMIAIEQQAVSELQNINASINNLTGAVYQTAGVDVPTGALSPSPTVQTLGTTRDTIVTIGEINLPPGTDLSEEGVQELSASLVEGIKRELDVGELTEYNVKNLSS
ncbi:phage tail tape measure protein [Candidatus Pacearchaeota archaeon]|nr:phage tail tape measure protein [Candidatus Pacearchaeota archaeon]